MTAATLQEIADLVVRRAQRQGFILAREVREELTSAGQDEQRWKEVVSLAGTALRHKSGRYYYSAPVTERVKAEQTLQLTVQETVRELVRQHKEASRKVERRARTGSSSFNPSRWRPRTAASSPS